MYHAAMKVVQVTCPEVRVVAYAWRAMKTGGQVSEQALNIIRCLSESVIKQHTCREDTPDGREDKLEIWAGKGAILPDSEYSVCSSTWSI